MSNNLTISATGSNLPIVLQPAGEVLSNSANTAGSSCHFFTFIPTQTINIIDINIYRTSTTFVALSCAMYNTSNVRVGYYLYPSATTSTKFTFPMTLDRRRSYLLYRIYGTSHFGNMWRK